MTDTLSARERSKRMGRVRNKDTRPEMLVRSLTHRLGYRFRLHRKDLPGRPDLVFPSRKKVVFVHGCFWHRHPLPDCRLARMPKSKLDFWEPKLRGNRERDIENERRLHNLGWSVLTIWECQLGDLDDLQARLQGFLEGISNGLD